MSLDSDVIVDRRRIRRKLTFWRVFAAVLIFVLLIDLMFRKRPGRSGDAGDSGVLGFGGDSDGGGD